MQTMPMLSSFGFFQCRDLLALYSVAHGMAFKISV